MSCRNMALWVVFGEKLLSCMGGWSNTCKSCKGSMPSLISGHRNDILLFWLCFFLTRLLRLCTQKGDARDMELGKEMA